MAAIEDQARSIFLAALERAPDEWPALLGEACGGDAELRGQVEHLLRAHQVLGTIRTGATAATDESPPEGTGESIGPYKLVQEIGEGGMGTVFLAQQQEPVNRLVALKVIKPGMDSRQVLARFEAERQALALMDHPNIAKVLDAGATAEGRPYFVMELVKGQPITRYCDDHRLGVRDRLGLFADVCRAVQHAHQKGIIHRDIKPSNVLVAPYDGRPVVKVIDFGIAKAAGQPLTNKTLVTGFGTVVGTPEYMSPEQAELNNQDIDTRSDVFSLGVLLYELLTGTTPLTRKRLQQAALLEVLRLVREEEPPRPSSRLSTTDELPSIAANRGLEPRKLSGLVRGDLDWIVMRALEKDRGRRYETAAGFAADLQRYLVDQPVEACPPSARYRLRKLVRRNKVTISAAALILFALVGGITGTTWGMVRAERARKAESDRADGEVRANTEARQQAAIARAVDDFLQRDLLGQADPGGELGYDPDVKVRTLLDRAARNIEGRFAGQPRTEAAIRQTIGNTYLTLGEFDPAERHLERSVRLRAAELGGDHPDTLQSKTYLARVYFQQAKDDKAEQLLLDIVAARTARLGPDDLDTLDSRFVLAALYARQWKNDRAEALLLDVLARALRYGESHILVLRCKHELGALYSRQRKFDQAEPLLQDAVRLATATMGANNAHTLVYRSGLALMYFQRGDFDRAESMLREVLNVRTALLSPLHPALLDSKQRLGVLYGRQRKFDQAEPLLREVVVASEGKLGKTHPRTLQSSAELGSLYLEQGDLDRAMPLLIPVVQHGDAVLGKDHPATVKSMYGLGVVYSRRGEYDRAEPLLEEAVPKFVATVGKDHPPGLRARQDLAMLYHHRGQPDRAEPILRECLAVLVEQEPESPRAYNTQSLLGGVLVGQKRYAEAEPLLKESYEGMKWHEARAPGGLPRGPLPRHATEALERLVRLYTAWNKPDEAARWQKELEARPKETKREPKEPKKPKDK